CAEAASRDLHLRVQSAREELNGDHSRVRLEAVVERDFNNACVDLTGRRLRLTWYRAPAVELGALFRAQVVVRRPRSYRNPGGFDYALWLTANDLQGTGYIKSGRPVDAPQVRSGLSVWIDTARATVSGFVTYKDYPQQAVLLALATADQSLMSVEQWDRFRATGTVHLMVVSGLHVGIAGLLFLALGQVLARLVPSLLLICPAYHLAGLVMITGATAYVALCGFDVPASRALIMLIALQLCRSLGRRLASHHVLHLAFAGVLFVHPLALLQPGFWLSFGAVWILIKSLSGRVRQPGWMGGVVFTQVVFFAVFSPYVGLFSGQFATAALFSNLIAVPLVSLVAVPLILVSTLFLLIPGGEFFAGLLMAAADSTLSLVMDWLDRLDFMPVFNVIERTVWIALVLGFSGLLLFYQSRPRHLMLLLGAALAAWAPAVNNIPHGAFQITAFDVGQGSSILIQPRRHRLLYDTGPAFPGGFDLGSAAVVPALRSDGRGLDRLLLSHGDIDHTGGFEAIVQAFPEVRSDGNALGLPRCSGLQWVWDDVTFRILHPVKPGAAEDNDQSCVLLIRTAEAAVLIAGDISSRIEIQIAAQSAAEIEDGVDLLFAPHHGSRTSSSAGFVARMKPAVVFISSGYRSRYGHPHPDVVQRYRDQGAQVWTTAEGGALMWRSDERGRVSTRREDEWLPWEF
ncbi:MAG: DNA internalization-related competence protein ComEC/Rec2, partial [Proteobacteria bacterium]|nr:DNA internalization-related competence protein ComEC/Rec2 [Pseudomonadota bacterium]